MNRQRKGFTLIELLAVLVILAILSLITVPIVIKTINNSKISSYERSVEMYGKSVEQGLLNYATENDTASYVKVTDWDSFQSTYQKYIKNTGNPVICKQAYVDRDGKLRLYYCYTKESAKDNVYYSYVDGKVTSSKLNNITKSYKMGTKIKIKDKNDNDMYFYVIENSASDKDYVVALKETPLTVDEVKKYGIDDDGINHINQYTASSLYEPYDIAGDKSIGGVAWYSSNTCKKTDRSGCVDNYDKSDIKYIVDYWARDLLEESKLKKIDNYLVRLIKMSEYRYKIDSYSWANTSDYMYWTNDRLDYRSWLIPLRDVEMYSSNIAVRPIANIYKWAIEEVEE